MTIYDQEGYTFIQYVISLSGRKNVFLRAVFIYGQEKIILRVICHLTRSKLYWIHEIVFVSKIWLTFSNVHGVTLCSSLCLYMTLNVWQRKSMKCRYTWPLCRIVNAVLFRRKLA